MILDLLFTFAAYLGNLPAVKALVSGHLTSGNYGTPPMDPTTADRKHRLTPLHIAAYKGHVAKKIVIR